MNFFAKKVDVKKRLLYYKSLDWKDYFFRDTALVFCDSMPTAKKIFRKLDENFKKLLKLPQESVIITYAKKGTSLFAYCALRNTPSLAEIKKRNKDAWRKERL